MAQLFVSDTHFFHLNLTQAGRPDFTTKRPYKDPPEMNEALIKNWNAKVQPSDEVYHDGDVCMGPSDKWMALLERLNGRIYLIKGNHDKKVVKEPWVNRFEWVKDAFFLKTQNPLTNEKLEIYLHHYACKVWEHSHKGSYHLYGHSHGNLEDDPNSLSFDVGIDAGHGFAPMTLKEVCQAMSKKKWKPVDHHGEETNAVD
jgi:calcineurin-like phosphoesterase family protein